MGWLTRFKCMARLQQNLAQVAAPCVVVRRPRGRNQPPDDFAAGERIPPDGLADPVPLDQAAQRTRSFRSGITREADGLAARWTG